MFTKSFSYLLSALVLWLSIQSCTRDKGPLEPVGTKLDSRTIKGKAYLENQTDHFGIFVYLEELKQYALTDEKGDYTLTLADSLFSDDTLTIQGTFHIYYSFPYYDFDSTSVTTDRQGFVFGRENLDSNGRVIPMELNQVLSIKTATDKIVYTPEDSLWVQVRISNCSERELGISFTVRTVDLFSNSTFWYYSDSVSPSGGIEKLAPAKNMIIDFQCPLVSIRDRSWGISLPWRCRVWFAPCYITLDANKTPKAPWALKRLVGPYGWFHSDIRFLKLPINSFDVLMRDSFSLAEITVIDN